MIIRKFQFSIAVLLPLSLLFILQSGCKKTSPVETLRTRFDAMRSSADVFYIKLAEIKDLESAEAKLPELETIHKTLSDNVIALDVAEMTSSRAARSLKKEILDYKSDSKLRLRAEFDRLKKDPVVNQFMEPFLRRLNAY